MIDTDRLAALLADRLAMAYRARPAEVAAACDEVIDPSGNLLGWLRGYAQGVRVGDDGLAEALRQSEHSLIAARALLAEAIESNKRLRVGDDGLRAAAQAWADADCECTHEDDCPMGAAEYALRAALASSAPDFSDSPNDDYPFVAGVNVVEAEP